MLVNLLRAISRCLVRKLSIIVTLILFVFGGLFSSVHADTTPLDKFYSNQWGMQILNMPKAWDITRGTAYIGIVDQTGMPCLDGTGTVNIQCVTSHPDLKQNFRPQFSKNFYYIRNSERGISKVFKDNLIDEKKEYDRDGSTTHDATSIGHSAHVAGIIAATPYYGPYSNGDSNSGVAGACWTCSFAMLRRQEDHSTWSGVKYAADHGSQVINMSFTAGDVCDKDCAPSIAAALARDVTLVGSSGNNLTKIQYPARKAGVIAVGGIKNDGTFWDNGYEYYVLEPYDAPTTRNYGCRLHNPDNPSDFTRYSECGSNFGRQEDGSLQFVAPAKDIVSTFSPNSLYSGFVHCGDAFGLNEDKDGYGYCTGTSMAAPHVAGIIGLMRSINPLLRQNDSDVPGIKSLLIASGKLCANDPEKKCGYGYPDAELAVKAVLNQGAPANATVKNRLSPLFSFYSASAQDHFYTVVPQMAIAALTTNNGLEISPDGIEGSIDGEGKPVPIEGNLLPQPIGGPITYESIGDAVPTYTQFPSNPVAQGCAVPPCSSTPKAIALVFTTHNNPISLGSELTPLYRYSWACTNSSCGTQLKHVSHFYSTRPNESLIASSGYQLDGIEGYVFPINGPQPDGTRKLCRKRDNARSDYALVLGEGPNGSDCESANVADGTGGNYSIYNSTVDSLGWVYPAIDSTGQAVVPQPVCADVIWCNSNVDATPPNVTITKPINNATVSGTVNVDVTAYDVGVVTNINVMRDGVLFAQYSDSPIFTQNPKFYSASLDTTSLPDGIHVLKATAKDKASNVGSSANVTINVQNKKPTTTTLASSLNPSVAGQSVTFTVTVLGTSPTGTVKVKDGGTEICSQTLSNSQASCMTGALSVGSHSMTAVYVGDATNAASTSQSVLIQTVNQASTTTAISSHTPNPSNVGAPIAVSASATANAPGARTPTGKITVTDGSASCTITLPTASCNLTPTIAGLKTLSATYEGSTDFKSSTVSVSHQVNPVATTIGLASSANPSVYGQSATITATVNGYAPTGTVTFSEAGSNLCANIAISNAKATCPLNSLPIGVHNINATYSGDANNVGSSAALQQNVDKASTTIPATPTLISPNVDTVNSTTPTYKWNAVPGATSYTLKTGKGTVSTSTDTQYSAASLGCDSGTGVCAITQSIVRNPGITFSWSVMASNSAGNSPWSAVMTFRTVDITAPTVSVTQPTNGATIGGTVTVSATVTDDLLGTLPLQFYLDGQPLGAAINVAPYTLTFETSAIANGAHTIVAKSTDGAGNVGVSPSVGVTLYNAPAPGLVTPVSPIGTASSVYPTFVWNAVAGARSYTVHIPNVGNFQYVASAAGCSTGTGTCSAKPSITLQSGISYDWYVTAENYMGPGACCLRKSFLTP